MSELQDRIRAIYENSQDWGHETNRRVELEIGLSLTPAQRLRWLEEMQETFLPAIGTSLKVRGPESNS